MSARRALIALSCLGLVAAGCGGNDSAPSNGTNTGGATTGADWQTRCERVVDHNASCGKGSDDQAAVTECIAVQNCAPAVWSTDVVDGVMGCLETLECDQPDDDCIAATADLQTATKSALFEACEDKTSSCPGFDGCVETMFLVSDQLASKLIACLEQDCDAASTCIRDEYLGTAVAADCSGELPFGG